MSLRHALAGIVAGALGYHGAHLYLADSPGAYDALTSRLMAEEGFRPLPYRDTRGILTWGYGRNLTVALTVAEGRYLLASSLDRNAAAFVKAWPAFDDMPLVVRESLLDMAFELGPGGVLGFHDMLAALERRDWSAAADAALDSVWARTEAPARAKRIAEALRAL